MTPHQNEGKIRAVLENYKKSLNNWVDRANNDSPPARQQGRILQEIDQEALTAICDEMERIAEKARPGKNDVDGLTDMMGEKSRVVAFSKGLEIGIDQYSQNLKAALAKERGE